MVVTQLAVLVGKRKSVHKPQLGIALFPDRNAKAAGQHIYISSTLFVIEVG